MDTHVIDPPPDGFKIKDGHLLIDGKACDIRGIRFRRHVGQGAFGAVFECFERPLERFVAVKLWLPWTLGDTTHLKRALAEARIIAKLRHPHIVSVHHIGVTSSGFPYCVMDFVPGYKISDINFRAKPHRDRDSLWHRIVDALHYAHTRHVFHGDLHGGNVLVNNFVPTIIDYAEGSIAPRSKPEDTLARLEAKRILELFSTIFPETRLHTCLAEGWPRNPDLAIEVCLGTISVVHSITRLNDAIQAGADIEHPEKFCLQDVAILLTEDPAFNLQAVVDYLLSGVLDESIVGGALRLATAWVDGLLSDRGYGIPAPLGPVAYSKAIMLRLLPSYAKLQTQYFSRYA